MLHVKKKLTVFIKNKAINPTLSMNKKKKVKILPNLRCRLTRTPRNNDTLFVFITTVVKTKIFGFNDSRFN